jgi:hypothetical protein
MLVVLRIIFGAIMYWAYKQARLNAQLNPMAGDLSNAYWTAFMVFGAIANAMVWAPYFGEKVADPLTGGTINSEYRESSSFLLRLIRAAQRCGLRDVVCWLCFLEGVRAPYLPTAFVIGMQAAREGSWFEKIYAREVFKFNNAQNCLAAFKILKSHGIDPRPHAMPGVNLLLISSEHEVKHSPAALDVPESAPPPKIERNPRIDIGL